MVNLLLVLAEKQLSGALWN